MSGRIKSYLGFLSIGLLSSLYVVGCDSGGGGGLELALGGGQATVQPYSQTNVNSGLSGRLYVSSQFDSEYLDLQTGEMVKLTEGQAYPNIDGSEFIELVTDYDFIEGVGCFDTGNIDRIVIRDSATGWVNDAFALASNVYGPVRLSPDRQTMALVWSPACGADLALTLFDRSGNLIARYNSDFSHYAWLPDNRLIISSGQRIFVERQRHTLAFSPLVDLSNVHGWPDHIVVSPDGQWLMFEMVTENPLVTSTIDFRNATVWRMRIDGSSLAQIATTSRADSPESSIDDPQINILSGLQMGSIYL